MNALKKIPLEAWHVSAGAKMAEFAGYSMPISYPAGELKEISAVRKAAGLFDISHMRPIFVEGLDSREFLNGIVTRNLKDIVPGEARYGLVTDAVGRTLDDVIVYRLPLPAGIRREEPFLVISNACNGGTIVSWLKIHAEEYRAKGKDVTVADGYPYYAFFSIQGPAAEAVLKKVIVKALSIPTKPYRAEYMLLDGNIDGGVFSLVATTGYTGEFGYEILIPDVFALSLWEAILREGKDLGAIACGLASRDVLRLEAGMPLYGHEIDLKRGPMQAGLGRYADLTKDFIGRKALEHEKAYPKEFFHSLTLPRGRVPRAEDKVYADQEGKVFLGQLTSAGYSPTLGKNIAMAYFSEKKELGSKVYVNVSGTLREAEIVKRPFYKRETK